MSNGPVSFTVNFMLPNGATSSFDFDLQSASSDCVITYSPHITTPGYTYPHVLGTWPGTAPAICYDNVRVPDFTATGSSCGTLAFSRKIVDKPANCDNFITENAGTEAGFRWKTDTPMSLR